MFYITGDIHGDLDKLIDFCLRMKGMISSEDVMIILGDCGFNYYLNENDDVLKQEANELGITLFCVKGNHEIHPDMLPYYSTKEWNGATVYYQEEYPNILFAKDGEIYDLDGKKTLVIGGAYSVDKFYRLARGLRWFPSEQPSSEVKNYVFKQLNKVDWKVDVVLSHTAPLKTEPTHLFLPGVSQDEVDKTTEEFLDEISDKLEFEKWYFGHYHGDWKNGKFQLMFNQIAEF